jgi:hypothetical protein
MEELGPMGSPPGGPTYCVPYAITLRALCYKLLTRFICNHTNTVRLQLVRQYQRLPLDDSPKMVIRDYEE